MSATPTEPLTLLGRAAELRAAGASWADAAAQLAVTHDELRRLVSEHGRDYERLARRARADCLRETLDAALSALRVQVKSPDPRLSYLAATTVVRYELARMRHGAKEAGSRLERDTAARKRKETTAGTDNGCARNVSESPEVQNRQNVAAAKNVARPTASPAPKPAPATPAAPAAANSPAPPDDVTRRKQRLVDDLAQGRTATAPDKRLDLEIQRLAGRPLTQ